MLETKLLLLLFGIALLSYFGSLLYRFYALQKGVVAEVNKRSAHDIPVPTGSGLVLLMVFCFSLLILWYWEILGQKIILACLGPLLVSIIGFLDDRGEIAVSRRILLYLVAAIWTVIVLGFPTLNFLGYIVDLHFAGLLLAVISLFWLQNLFNFMDGMDGIAASEVIFVCLSVIVIVWPNHNEWTILCLICCLLALGYLPINLPPAKLFMGDAGSNLFGLLLGLMIISGELVSIWVWIILLSQFIVDACLTVCVRLVKKEKIYESHSQHAYQHLNRKFGTKSILFLTISINLLWLYPLAWFAHLSPDHSLILLTLAVLPIALKDWFSGAGKDLPRLHRLQP
ncbi:MAG: Fuc2NAc and GlcNAc transferase [Flavobacterium sp.]|jgi:Fuc2NAc and GlcNAc transferase